MVVRATTVTTTVAITTALIASTLLVAVSDAACTNPIVRSEWSQLTADQKSLYVAATQALAARPASGQYVDPTQMGWDDFVQTHSHMAYWAHGNAQFYPYHRALMWNFELALRSTGIWPSTIGVPYFDWSAMSQNWWTSDIFSTDNFGPINNADPTTAPCVVEGAFAWHTVADDPDKHRVITSGNLTCLRRNAIQTAMTDATTISESLSATSFVQLTRSAPSDYYDTTNYHADGHAVFGGDGGDMANAAVSPNDPLFYLHHGFVDKYWWRWQQLCPSFVTDYEGNLERADDPISGGSTVADFNQTFDSWSNFIVWDMLNTEGDTLCYTYSASAGDLAIPAVTCPAVAAVNVPATTTSSVSATSAAAAAESAVDNSWVDAIFITLIASTTFSENNTSTVIFGRRDIRADASTVNRNITTSDAAIIEIKTAEAKSDFENSQASNTVDSINTISTSTATKLTWTFTLNPDNSSTVFYIGADHNITVPAGYSISEVFRGSVTGINKSTRKPKRFFPEVGSIVYVRHPDTPVVVVPGEHPCHLAAPILLKSSYIEAMGMSWAVYLNAHNVEKMKIDAFNINNCTTLSSPSSMMNQ